MDHWRGGASSYGYDNELLQYHTFPTVGFFSGFLLLRIGTNLLPVWLKAGKTILVRSRNMAEYKRSIQHYCLVLLPCKQTSTSSSRKWIQVSNINLTVNRRCEQQWLTTVAIPHNVINYVSLFTAGILVQLICYMYATVEPLYNELVETSEIVHNNYRGFLITEVE